VLHDESEVRGSRFHLPDRFRAVLETYNNRDQGIGFPKFAEDGRKNDLGHCRAEARCNRCAAARLKGNFPGAAVPNTAERTNSS
jgi:hypothetical protein